MANLEWSVVTLASLLTSIARTPALHHLFETPALLWWLTSDTSEEYLDTGKICLFDLAPVCCAILKEISRLNE